MFTRISDFDRMFGAMDLLRNRMGRVFGDFDPSFEYAPGVTFTSGYPRTNLYDDGDNFQIMAEVPGISKNDLHVKIQGNYLEINGSRQSDRPEGYQVSRTERGTREFTRSFTLPAEVDSNKVRAMLKDGILHLTLPKLESAKPKQISIS